MQHALAVDHGAELVDLEKQLVTQTHKLILAGRSDEAIAIASQLCAIRPDSPRAHTLLHQARMSAGDRAGANTAQRRAIALIAEQLAQSPHPMSLQERMSIFGEHIFIGGPRALFVKIGKLQLEVLQSSGLREDHKVLDVGCGCLRAGVHIMSYLDPGNYYGLEPNTVMLEFGKKHVVGPHGLAASRPNFNNNFEFDFTPFKATFDFFVARSIWTHASKTQIGTMLDGFQATGTRDAIFLASFYPALTEDEDYKGASWTGRSESSSIGGCVRHDPTWITRACAQRGLKVRTENAPIENGQVWLRVTRNTA